MERSDGQAPQNVVRPPWAEALLRHPETTARSFYKAHFPAIRTFLLRNNGTVDDAQDMFQEAMSVLWLKVQEGGFPFNAEPGAFLFRVAKYKWLDNLRSARNKHMRVVTDEHMEAMPADADDGTDERIARLREVYAAMDERCRDILGRFYFEEQDLATIAAAMGVEEDSIRTIKYRCMMKLRAFRQRISGQHA